MQRVLALAAYFAISGTLRAQCPDGSPPIAAGICSRPPLSGVAVLYFENVSRDTNYAYLAAGLTESLIDRLAQAGVHVASRFQVRRLGTTSDPASLTNALGVAHVLTGTVRPVGTALRVTVELARLPSGARIWGRQYDREASDLLSIEADIATSVADSVAGRLKPRLTRLASKSVTANPKAYDHYQHGRFLFGQRTSPAVLRAIQELETATRLDPRSATLRAQLSLAYVACHNYCLLPDSTRRSMLFRALATADSALRRDSSSAAAWTSKATAVNIAAVNGVIDPPLTPSLAARFSLRAITLDSTYAEAWHAYGDCLLSLDDPEGAGKAFARALALEPGSGEYLHHLGRVAVMRRAFAEALAFFDSAKASEPGYSPPEIAHWQIRMLIQLGNMRHAREILSTTSFARTSLDAQLLFAEGDTAGARLLMAQLSANSLAAARAYAMVGDHARALAILANVPFPRALKRIELRGPEYDQLRDDAAFQRLWKESEPRPEKPMFKAGTTKRPSNEEL